MKLKLKININTFLEIKFDSKLHFKCDRQNVIQKL